MIAQFKHRAYKQAISDRLAGTSPEARIPDGGRTQRIFNRTMFVVMGKGRLRVLPEGVLQ